MGGWSSGKLTYPFSKLKADGSGDLQQALHRTDLVEQEDLFAGGVVAMFAKYKAFQNGNDFTDRYSDSGSARKTALVNANYGISIPTSSSLGTPTSGFFYNLLHSGAMWSYSRPNKNNGHILRPWDFDGYIDYAVNIMAQLTIASFMLDSNNALTITWPDAILPEGDDCQLYPSEVKVGSTAVTGMYFGLLVYYSNSQYTWAAQNLVGTSKSVTFSNMSLYAGKTVSVVPFLSTIAIAQSQSPSGTVTLASFNLAPVSVAITENVPNWSVSGTFSRTFGSVITFDLTATNNTNVSRTMEFNIWMSDSLDGSTTIGTNSKYTTKTVAGQGSVALKSDDLGTFSVSSGTTCYGFIEGSYGGDVVERKRFSVLTPNQN